MKRDNGFTLIELVLTLSIIGLMMSIVLPNFSALQRKAKEHSVKSLGYSLQIALESYYLSKGIYPSSRTIEDLLALLKTSQDFTQKAVNPFTAEAYVSTDSSGKIQYSFNSDTGTYSLTAFGQGNKEELLTLKNM